MSTLMDLGLLRGLITLIAFGAFLGLVFWAYSGRRRSDFDALSQIPLETDAIALDNTAAPQKEARHD